MPSDNNTLDDKNLWMQRFSCALLGFQPNSPTGLLPEIAETFWYYHRHREPREAARARAEGRLRMVGRKAAWIQACSAAIRGLDPQLGNEDTLALAATLWEEDWARTVDPYLMAQALWDQAILLATQSSSDSDMPPSLFTVFRNSAL
ncbi:MAG: hypothetical protein ABW190_14450 [Rhizobacter sp.]